MEPLTHCLGPNCFDKAPSTTEVFPDVRLCLHQGQHHRILTSIVPLREGTSYLFRVGFSCHSGLDEFSADSEWLPTMLFVLKFAWVENCPEYRVVFEVFCASSSVAPALAGRAWYWRANNCSGEGRLKYAAIWIWPWNMLGNTSSNTSWCKIGG